MLWKNSFTFPGLYLDDPWPTFNWENPNVACSLLLFSSAYASPWLWKFWMCCVSFQSPQPVSPMPHKEEKQVVPPLTPVYFPCLFRKRITLPYYAKASHQDLMFCHFSTMNPWSFLVIALKDSILFYWWCTLLTYAQT